MDVGDEISHFFWKRFRKAVKAVKKDLLIIGEIWHYAGDFLEGDEWDTVMNYPFYLNLIDLLADEKIKCQPVYTESWSYSAPGIANSSP